MEEIEIPSGINIDVQKTKLVVSSSGKSLEISYNDKIIEVKNAGGKVSLNIVGKTTKPKLASMRAVLSILKNAFMGLTTGFSKKLQVVYSHFPVSIEVKGAQMVVKNFLGEKMPRTAEIVNSTKVEVKGQEVLVSGHDKYAVGQTANNLITATQIRGKDRRIFQDGIYLVE